MDRQEFMELEEVTSKRAGFEKSELKAKVRTAIKDDALTLDEIVENAEVAAEMVTYNDSGKKTKAISAIKSYLNSDTKKGLVIARQETNGPVRYIKSE